MTPPARTSITWISLTALVGTVLVVASGTAAEDLPLFPGARLDEKATKQANDLMMFAGRKTLVTIYWTDDEMDEVKAFYRGKGTEVQPQLSKESKLPSGRVRKEAFFILDGSSDLRKTNKFVKIQRPAMNLNGSEGPDVTMIIFSQQR